MSSTRPSDYVQRRRVDGVFEINQTCALSGCFPGDAPGFPVEITTDGSYRLTSNLFVDNGDVTAIFIPYATLVTLDLNGFVIRGSYSCATAPPTCPSMLGYGVRVGPTGQLRLRNGGITRIANSAIRLDSGSTVTVEGVTVFYVGGRGIDASGHVTVRLSFISQTLGDGIHATFAKVFDTRVTTTGGDAIDILDRGEVWGVETSGNNAGSLRLHPTLASYSLCRLDRKPVGGVNFGQNLCADVGPGGICP